ncbi:hypothetical protein C7974DRAFT_107724 [Boeremia exigua]|uniref:uncharacterized protein n=1 Tax=Boeremia exigua TaxID=749465 RepID=UPI001E8DE9E8|nr:uncharacterized protein C7974DRAFT_107724 [Boeremia exigua]KAH6642723.1 hypothetical protein C7974DRAFT_107724 [Boeremia exigua]
MLLHYRHRPVSERAWVPKTKPRSPLVQAPLKKTYFGLLRPLIRLLRVVLQDSDPGDSDVRDGLEQYYLCFPSDGLCYDSIRYIYEAEAMIWVHGIYILTYVPRDLSILLQDDHLPSQSDFYSGCEHSLLLAEVIPTLLRLDPELRYCSPATVQFVLISSTLTCTALRQFCPSLDLGFSRLLSPQPPENLLTSARLHSRFLRCLCKPATRFSSNLTQAVLDILDRLLSRDCECQDAGLAEALSVLSRYRWRANGSGIIPSSDDVALSEVGPNHLQPRPSLRLPALANAKDIAGRRAAIEAICRADVRVCTSGCFDLNIRFLSPPRHGAEDLLSSPVISVGFRLNSVDNQLLRKVIRRCRVAFEAGFDSGSHMVNLLLPHALKWPAILHGMLSLSTTHSWRALPELIHHQETLRALSEESELVQNGFYEVDKVVGVLGCQFLLSMFALSECNEWWAHHNRGMIDVVRAAAWDELQASSLGCFLSGVCAMSDISVFSIGGSRPSQWCWLEWMIPQDVHTRPTACPLDSITGYPRSLIDIIARVAASADMHCNEDVQWNVRPNTFPTTAELEGLLQSWKAPPSSPQTDPYMKLIIKTTWDCIRKAASILLWRGKGFHSNILTEYPRERKPDRDLFVNEILSDLQAVFEMVRGRQISIGNLTLWALTVVGCECGRRSGVKRSRDVAALLRVLGRDFAMDHALRVHAMLEALWDAESKVPDSGIDLAVEGRYLSLETVTREQKLEILLL